MKMAGSCLQLDAGNSGAKWRMLRSGRVAQRGTFLPADEQSLADFLAGTEAPEQIWISSVASPRAQSALTHALLEQWGVQPWYARTQAETDGLVNSYADPARMGVDRWLAMLAARVLVKGRLCVVDAGSALTIDIVAENGQHEGGYIIPGAALMERALLLDTDRVRFEEDAGYQLAPGKSTAQAVRHGVALAQAGAVGLVLGQQKLANDQLVLCGGGGGALQQFLDGAGKCVPDLVFDGLALLAASRP